MDLSLQSRSLSSTFNNINKYNMPQDEMERNHRMVQNPLHQSSSFPLPTAAMNSKVSEITNDEHHHQQQQQQQQNQFTQHYHATASLPQPHCIERITELDAPLLLAGNTPKYTNLNGKDCDKPPLLDATLSSNTAQKTATCHNSINNLSMYLHEAENFNEAAPHSKHSSYCCDINDIKEKSITNPADSIGPVEHTTLRKCSPRHYQQEAFIHQQGRYPSSQNLSMLTTLTPKEHSAHQYLHKPLRSAIADLHTNQIMEHASLIPHQLELHMQQHSNASHYFPQSLQQRLALPTQQEILPPPSDAINENYDNQQYQRLNKACYNNMPPPTLKALKCSSKLPNFAPKNISSRDPSESMPSSEDFSESMRCSKKDKNTKKHSTEKFMHISGKESNNQRNKVDFQEEERKQEQESNQTKSQISTITTVSTASHLTNTLESEKQNFIQQKLKHNANTTSTTTLSTTTTATNISHNNEFHSIIDNVNQNVIENIKNHNFNENSLKQSNITSAISPKLSKAKKGRQSQNYNSDDTSTKFPNETSIITNNKSFPNAEDLRMQSKYNVQLETEAMKTLPNSPLNIDKSKGDIYNSDSTTKTSTTSETNPGNLMHNISAANKTKADILIDIVESSKKITTNTATISSTICTVNREDTKTPEKSCFEEVENKLEEMFAGIEDEPIVRSTNNPALSQDDVKSSKKDVEFEFPAKPLSGASVVPATNSSQTHEQAKTLTSSHSINEQPKMEGPLTTKAAKKSTETVIIHTKPEVCKFDYSRNNTNKIEDEKSGLSSLAYTTRPQNDANKVTDYRPNNKKSKIVKCAEEGLNSATSLRAGNMSSATNTDTIKKETRRVTSRRKCSKAKAPESGKCNPSYVNSKMSEQNKTIPRNRRNNSLLHSNEGTSTQPQQQQQQPEKPQQSERILRDSEVKHRSPFILIKKDGNVSVVNAATVIEDINEKNAKIKKTALNAPGHRSVRGLHSSTLGNKYDANTADTSWICVFCKLGPHKMGLGDLFGPYIATANCDEYTNALQSASNKPESSHAAHNSKRSQVDKISSKQSPIVPKKADSHYSASETVTTRRKRPASELVSHNDNNTSSLKSITTPDIFLGMCKVSDGNYEVWLHEDCAVWAPDILLVGSQLVGIANAVWKSSNARCSCCHKPGAVVCCLQRNCNLSAHLPCARQAHWSFDEATFWVYCQRHHDSRPHTSTMPSTSYAT